MSGPPGIGATAKVRGPMVLRIVSTSSSSMKPAVSSATSWVTSTRRSTRQRTIMLASTVRGKRAPSSGKPSSDSTACRRASSRLVIEVLKTKKRRSSSSSATWTEPQPSTRAAAYRIIRVVSSEWSEPGICPIMHGIWRMTTLVRPCGFAPGARVRSRSAARVAMDTVASDHNKPSDFNASTRPSRLFSEA